MAWLKSLLLGVVPVLLTAWPVAAAERIVFPLGKMELSISIDELERYAEQGRLPKNQPLGTYVHWLSPEEQRQVFQLLRKRYNFDSVALQHLLNSPMVKSFLVDLGRMIQTESGENGSEGIRTALIEATVDSDGFSVLEVLRQFPSATIQLNLEETLDVLVEVVTLMRQTDKVVASLEDLASIEAASSGSVDFNQMPDLRQPGSLSVTKRNLSLFDWRRNRQLEVDLYLPPQTATEGNSTPVLVISHGLASHRTRFERLAQHLASYGFAVAVPQHLGSDTQKLEQLLTGEESEIFEAQQFIDRPLDITFLLDQLERLNQKELDSSLNLNKVGILGHSFGGYTALTLAGATIDFEGLEANCFTEKMTLNPSMFLQCRALELPREDYQLKDDRVKAVMVLNPVNSSILGELGLSQIQVPILMAASSNDLLAPMLLEQVQSFTWLTASERYLVLKKGDHHFYDIDQSKAREIPGLSGMISHNLETTRGYMNALSVAFFQAHVADQSIYQNYLHASYTQSISEAPYNLSLIRSLHPRDLSFLD